VVDADRSDQFVASLRHHIGIVLLNKLISLVTSVPIAKDKVEPIICTIFIVVLKATQVMKHSPPLLNNGLSWEHEHLCTVMVRAGNL
jgi:hypothetical protein